MRGKVLGGAQGRVVRTYNYKRGTVIDHRTGAVADLKRVMNGDVDLLLEKKKK